MHMSLSFHTDNAILSLEQLEAKRDANKDERLRLVEEFQQFEAAHGQCTSVDTFNRNDLIGQMLLAGLLDVEDETVLAPADRLLLAQRRYLDQELHCLIEMHAGIDSVPRRVSFRKLTEREVSNRSARNGVDKNRILEPVVDDPRSDLVTAVATVGEAASVDVPVAANSEVGWRYYRNMEKLSVKERSIKLEEVKTRYASTVSQLHPLDRGGNEEPEGKEAILFDPASDRGVLITYGCQTVPAGMRISADDMILIEVGRRLVGLSPELPNKGSLTILPVNTKLAQAFRSGSLLITKYELEDLKKSFVLQNQQKKKAKVMMPVFDPTTDLGKLILWGEYFPAKTIKISTQHRQLINQTRVARGKPPLDFEGFASADFPASSPRLVPSGASFASQLSQYASFKAYPSLVQELSCAAEALEGEDDMDAVLVRYLWAARGGKKQADLMPVFDPYCDLGKLILAGRKSLSKQVIIPLEHAQLVEERLTTVRQQRSRVQRLLQQVQDLQHLVPPAQRANIPKKWLYLARELPSVDTEEEETAEGQGNDASPLALVPSPATTVRHADGGDEQTEDQRQHDAALSEVESGTLYAISGTADADLEKGSAGSIQCNAGVSTLVPPTKAAVAPAAIMVSTPASLLVATEMEVINASCRVDSSFLMNVGLTSGADLQQPHQREQHQEPAVLLPTVLHGSQQSTQSPAPAIVSVNDGSPPDDALQEYLDALQELRFLILIRLDDPEIVALVKTTKLVNQVSVMPVFDPRCALGRLILADKRPLNKAVIVPPEFAQLLQESRAEVQRQRARVRYLLQRVDELAPFVSENQRVNIPVRWATLAREPVWWRRNTPAGSTNAVTSLPPHYASPSLNPSSVLTRKERQKLRKRNRAVDSDFEASVEFQSNKRNVVDRPVPALVSAAADATSQHPALCKDAQQTACLLPTATAAAARGGSPNRTTLTSTTLPVSVPVHSEALEASGIGNMPDPTQNADTGGGFVLDDSSALEAVHDSKLSEQDLIRLELDRMKKMYDSWLCQ